MTSRIPLVIGAQFTPEQLQSGDTLTPDSIPSLESIGAYPQPTGTSTQYIRGDGSLAVLPSPSSVWEQLTGVPQYTTYRTLLTADVPVSVTLTIPAEMLLTPELPIGVYLNGILVAPSNYTITSSTEITILAFGGYPLWSGDEVIISFPQENESNNMGTTGQNSIVLSATETFLTFTVTYPDGSSKTAQLPLA